jgi:hypothetical protein
MISVVTDKRNAGRRTGVFKLHWEGCMQGAMTDRCVGFRVGWLPYAGARPAHRDRHARAARKALAALSSGGHSAAPLVAPFRCT